MLWVVPLCIIALAVSLDGFGVGVTYGLRKISIPHRAIAIIAGCSGLMIYISMKIGQLFTQLISVQSSQILGAIILIGIGIWSVSQAFIQRQESNDHSNETHHEVRAIQQVHTIRTILSVELKRLGLVIQILKTPSAADVDRSGMISPYEATLLGIALSLDAFGAGIGVAMIGFSPLITAVVIAFFSAVCIELGMHTGHLFSSKKWMHHLSFAPAIVLILLGISKLF